MAGQGTVVLELLQQVPDLDAVIVPVGGGGLASGCAVALHALKPGAHLFGAEPAGADDAFQSLHSGERVTSVVPHTICDGLRATIGEPNFTLLRERRVEVVSVDDEATLAAMRLAWTELKQTIEPSSAVVLAALLAQRERFVDRRVGLVLSGGNVDLDALPFIRR
jgi:threonine dehydratase